MARSVRAASSAPHEAGAPGSTRERILDVALDLFIQKGYTEASLREIAAELGFSKAALYYHFESKQDILLALHLRVHRILDGVLPELPEQEAGARWDWLLDHLIGVALRNRLLIELHFRNQEAIAELHSEDNLKRHGVVQEEMNDQIRGMILDPSLSFEERIRRAASLGAIGGVLFGAGAFADLPNEELEAAVRRVLRDIASPAG